MKFTLKDYQDEAVFDVLDNLRKARKRWREDKEPRELTEAEYDAADAGESRQAPHVRGRTLHE